MNFEIQNEKVLKIYPKLNLNAIAYDLIIINSWIL